MKKVLRSSVLTLIALCLFSNSHGTLSKFGRSIPYDIEVISGESVAHSVKVSIENQSFEAESKDTDYCVISDISSIEGENVLEYSASSRRFNMPGFSFLLDESGHVKILRATDTILTLKTTGRVNLEAESDRLHFRSLTILSDVVEEVGDVLVQESSIRAGKFSTMGKFSHYSIRRIPLGDCDIQVKRFEIKGELETYGNCTFQATEALVNDGSIAILQNMAKTNKGSVRFDSPSFQNNGELNGDGTVDFTGSTINRGRMDFSDHVSVRGSFENEGRFVQTKSNLDVDADFKTRDGSTTEFQEAEFVLCLRALSFAVPPTVGKSVTFKDGTGTVEELERAHKQLFSQMVLNVFTRVPKIHCLLNGDVCIAYNTNLPRSSLFVKLSPYLTMDGDLLLYRGKHIANKLHFETSGILTIVGSEFHANDASFTSHSEDKPIYVKPYAYEEKEVGNNYETIRLKHLRSNFDIVNTLRFEGYSVIDYASRTKSKEHIVKVNVAPQYLVVYDKEKTRHFEWVSDDASDSEEEEELAFSDDD